VQVITVVIPQQNIWTLKKPHFLYFLLNQYYKCCETHNAFPFIILILTAVLPPPWSLTPGAAAARPCPLSTPVYSGIYGLQYYLFIYLLARWKLKSTNYKCTLNARCLIACINISYNICRRILLRFFNNLYFSLKFDMMTAWRPVSLVQSRAKLTEYLWDPKILVTKAV